MAISDFSQNHTQTTTFHIIKQDRKYRRKQIGLHSKWKRTVLIIPLLANEFADASTLPAFENILKQLKDTTSLSKIIFGLDGASESEAFLLQDLIKKYGIRNDPIQRKSRPGFNSIYNQLSKAGFHIIEVVESEKRRFS